MLQRFYSSMRILLQRSFSSGVLLLLIVVMMDLLGTRAYAEEKVSKPLSMTTGRILSFLPLNTPAKFYTHHPIQGVTLTPVEGIGLTLLIWGAVETATDQRSDFNSNDAFTIIGGVLWFTPWLYTVLSTPDDVRSYNEKFLEQKKLTLQPALRLSRDGVSVSFTGHF